MTDSELKIRLDSTAQGDMTAFEELYTDMKKPVMTVIMRIIGNKETSEDILQEVFLKLFKSPPKEAIKPRAYIFKMAVNLSIDHLRSEKPAESLEDCDEQFTSPYTYDPERIDIERALAELPQTERSIITLHVNGGLKFREIADALGIPLGTVTWKYQKAIGKLRVSLESY